jgi:hypothetical protein
MADRFPSPFEMPTPPGAEGWQDLYAYSSVFSEDRREYEESAFWFMDGVHSPEAIPPWDATIVEYALIALSQYNTRHYVIPPARGVDIRILNGYMYLSPVGVADPKEIEARIPEFAERAGYYFANWDRLYAAWVPKVRAAHRRARDDQLLAAAGARGHGRHHRGPRHRKRAGLLSTTTGWST